MNIFRNCQDINLAALQLALSKTEPRTLERYYLTGRQMVLGEDIVAATGPDWLDGPGLQFNSVLLRTCDLEFCDFYSLPSLSAFGADLLH